MQQGWQHIWAKNNKRGRSRASRRNWVQCPNGSSCPFNGWSPEDRIKKEPFCFCGAAFVSYADQQNVGPEATIGKQLLAKALADGDTEKEDWVRKLFPDLGVKPTVVEPTSAALQRETRAAAALEKQLGDLVATVADTEKKLKEDRDKAADANRKWNEAKERVHNLRAQIAQEVKTPLQRTMDQDMDKHLAHTNPLVAAAAKQLAENRAALEASARALQEAIDSLEESAPAKKQRQAEHAEEKV